MLPPVCRKRKFYFRKGTPSPPAAELPPRKEPLKGDLLWVAVMFAMGGCLLGRVQLAPTQVRTSPQSPPRDVILSERQRDEVVGVELAELTKPSALARRDLRRNLRYPFNSKIYFRITWDFARRKSNFAFERGTPSPPAAELPPRKEPLKGDLLLATTLIDLWLLHSYKTPPTLVGGDVLDAPLHN